MKIKPIGAAGGEVTGSAYLVETKKARVLVDCGLFQGGKKSEALNRAPVRRDVKLDAVLLTHGHLDHTGRLPLLARLGYRGPVFATPATIEMTGLIVRDATRIQAQDLERVNRRLLRLGGEPLEPLFVGEDTEQILSQLKPVPYRDRVQVADGVAAQWLEAGHMLGSASIQILVEEDGREKRVIFSGDLGPKGIPILRDFEPFQQADLVFLESTYGDRDHRPFSETLEEFVRVVNEAVMGGGKVLVPTFAVGRAQLLLGLLGWMFRTGKCPPFPIFLDSPMAFEATNIYSRQREIFDDEMKRFLAEKPLREDLVTLKVTESSRESMQINDHQGTCMVLAGSGMCNAGRILHHLKHNLWKPETRVLFVGYQSQGSVGRQIAEGRPEVSIHGERVAVRAKVHSLGGFSAHAGQSDLLDWLGSVAASRPRVVLTHGENGPRQALADKVAERFGLETCMPQMGEVIEV